jgi:hypothetical protein
MSDINTNMNGTNNLTNVEELNLQTEFNELIETKEESYTTPLVTYIKFIYNQLINFGEYKNIVAEINNDFYKEINENNIYYTKFIYVKYYNEVLTCLLHFEILYLTSIYLIYQDDKLLLTSSKMLFKTMNGNQTRTFNLSKETKFDDLFEFFQFDTLIRIQYNSSHNRDNSKVYPGVMITCKAGCALEQFVKNGLFELFGWNKCDEIEGPISKKFIDLKDNDNKSIDLSNVLCLSYRNINNSKYVINVLIV